MTKPVTNVPWDPVVEHLARAIAKANDNDPDKLVKIEGTKFYVPAWQAFVPNAEVYRAAYEAMRETEKDKQH